MTDDERRLYLARLFAREGLVWTPVRRARLGLVLQFVGGVLFGSALAVLMALPWNPKLLDFVPPRLAGWIAVSIFPVGVIGGISFSLGRMYHRPQTRTAILNDSRLPILYLRDFRRDTRPVASPLGFSDAMSEERLASFFRSIGPLIALGRSDQSYQSPGGAFRLFTPDAHWVGTVTILMRCCQLTVLILDNRESLWMELAVAARVCEPTRLLLGLDKTLISEYLIPEKSHLLARASHALGHPLPDRVGRARYVYFDQDWTPRLIVTQSEWNDYVDALPSRTRGTS